ncbi:MAG: hypothetical protein JW751_15835 [Polyangiaceae bacterium]|nr:hypothetical protein [Polyangiaceae bacterium]
MAVLRVPHLFASLVALTTAVVAGSAAGQVPQPAPFFVDGTEYTSVPVDQAESGDYFDTSKFNVATLGLGALFNALGEPMHYQLDAGTEPAVFAPLCGLSGQMILRGGGCRMDFGWYCVDDPSTFVPLVTSADVMAYHDSLTGEWEQYKNDDKSFVPVIGMPPVQGAPLEDIQNHPVFQACPSKHIGFSIKPVAGAAGEIPSVQQAVCTQQKFSEARLNTIHTASGQPWVSALSYASRKSPGIFYIAFEDLPSDGATFNPPVDVGDDNWVADGDFNDFVYRIQGIQCVGGGQRCDTNKAGICSIGITECTVNGEPGECTQMFEPSGEVCDNVDNDCDGTIDGDGLCPPETPVCAGGVCVGRCSTGEFPCDLDKVCDPAIDACVDPACLGVVCTGENEHCEKGSCVGGCQGVVCPSGQDCLFGNCVDLCQGTSCPDGFVCVAGACITDCNCLPCSDGFACGADGKCIDTACQNVICPAGQVCREGACVDPCVGVTCPAGQACNPNTGICEDDPVEGTGGSMEGTGGGAIVDGSGGVPGIGGATMGATSGTGQRLAGPPTEDGCGCRTVQRGRSGSGLALLSLLGLAVRRLRRERKPRR